MIVYNYALVTCFLCAIILTKYSDESPKIDPPLSWWWAGLKTIGEVVFFWDLKTYRIYAKEFGDPSLWLFLRSLGLVLVNAVRWTLIFYCLVILQKGVLSEHWLLIPLALAGCGLVISAAMSRASLSLEEVAVGTLLVEEFLIITSLYQILDSLRPALLYSSREDDFLRTVALALLFSSAIGFCRDTRRTPAMK